MVGDTFPAGIASESLFPPTLADIERTQTHIIERLEQRPNGDGVSAGAIFGAVEDAFVARAILIDELIAATRPHDAARIEQLNGAMRNHYSIEIRGDAPPQLGVPWHKGVGPEVASILEGEGIHVVHGTTQELTSSYAGPLTTLSSWPTSWRVTRVAAPLGRPLQLSETISVDQRLCDGGSIGTSPPARGCEDLPPAEIVPPAEGDREVASAGPSVPGSTVRVWSEAEGREIGDASEGTVNLDRPLVAMEWLRIMRDLGACRGPEHFFVQVSP